MTGQGPPILFLHGYPETSLTWRHAFDAFHTEYTCYAPDLPGWGLSTIGHRPTLENYADDMAKLIAHLGLSDVTVVGHDWGAAIAYGLALEYPDLVRRLVTVNFSPGRFQIWRAVHFAFFALPLLPELAMTFRPGWIEAKLMRWWTAHGDAFPRPVWERYIHFASTSRSRRTTLASYRNMVYRALIGIPPFRMGPTGLGRKSPPMEWGAIWGLKDPIATPVVLERFCSEFPHVSVKRVESAGHFPHEETPRQFAAALRELLGA